MQQGLRAHALFKLDIDYVVKDGQVVIVDEFTGRLMPGRRWSDGLHQAVEAKEKVKIERENQTLATITLQNYFRKYNKLSGMTGTADTEAEEFGKIYKLDVVVVPTNRPLTRIEEPDLVYRTEDEKFEAIVADVAREAGGRPPGPGRHGLGREVGAAVRHAAAARRQARRAERQVPRAGSRDRRPGRPPRHRHRGHQHGRPRHRHPARRQRRVHGPPAGARRRGGRRAAAQDRKRASSTTTSSSTSFTSTSFYRVPRARLRADLRRAEGAVRRRARPGRRAPAACTSSAPSGTSRGASTTSCAAAPAARAIPARRASTCRSKTT